MDNFSKYKKYKSKCMRLSKQMKELKGGAKDEDKKTKTVKKSSDTKDKTTKHEDFPFVMHIESTHIKQESPEMSYESKVSKNPAMRLHFRESSIKVASIVKRILSYVNKYLRMTDVKEVHIKMDKETKKFKGDNLEEMIDVSKEPTVKEFKVVMGYRMKTE